MVQAKKAFLTGKNSEWFLCSPASAAAEFEDELSKILGLRDNTGNLNLSSIIFKPRIMSYYQLSLSERIDDSQCYINLMDAIRDS